MAAQLHVIIGVILLAGAGCDEPQARDGAAAGSVQLARAPARARVFQPVVAGQFYPGTAGEIRKLLSRYLEAAQPGKLTGKLVGLVSPHAGYVYSGPVAAYGYKLLEGRSFERVVVLAPSHRVYSEKIGTLPHDAYRTPLGELTIDRKAVDTLVDKYDFVAVEEKLFSREHALEVQLPFLQTVLPGVPLVPLVYGNPDAGLARKLARALHETFPGSDTLVIASSDLTHFLTYEVARSKDLTTLGHITRNEQDKLASKHGAPGPGGRRESLLCGFGPVLTLMELARLRGATGTQIRYGNSGDTAGDKSRVVGYGVVVFAK